jgi:tripartite tricarboxylate transporter TctB family protein
MSYVQRSTMTLVMLLIFVTMVWIASSYPANSRFMPFVVGIPAIGLCLLQLVLDARERRRESQRLDAQGRFEKAEESISRIAGRKVDFEVAHEPLPITEAEPEIPRPELVRREIVLWVWFLGFISSILLLGFWLTIPVFLVAFLRFQAGASWRNALLLGLGASALLMYVFEMVFRIEVHPGFFTEYIRERLQG